MRPSWNDYFMSIAKTVSTRSTCPRASVGAVLVKDNRIIAAGYNGAGAGMRHCTEVGHLMQNNHCIRAVHAEVNAVAQAARNGVSVEGAVLYCTHSPCYNCAKLLIACGIKEIHYDTFYDDELARDALKEADIEAYDASGNNFYIKEKLLNI